MMIIVLFYIIISRCLPLFHLQGLSVRDTNFVHWLSVFCYPDRTTATLLDQMDHTVGYTFRPANKTTYNSRTSFILKTEMSHPIIHLYIRMLETELKLQSNLDPL